MTLNSFYIGHQKKKKKKFVLVKYTHIQFGIHCTIQLYYTVFFLN